MTIPCLPPSRGASGANASACRRFLRFVGAHGLRGRILLIFGILAFLNVGAWAWAFAAFHDHPALLGTALLIYGLGLRHAVDADHIAAIDNVTRKLMQQGQSPVSVGFFFAMGHSTIVVFVAVLIASAAAMFSRVESLKNIGGAISASVSALFLIAIAAINLVVFVSIYKRYRALRRGDPFIEDDLDVLLAKRGFLTRIFRPLFGFVTRGWHMFPLGFLFGLGFDTATEIAMFGIAAAQAAKGVSFEAVLVFPTLFAAGMSLVDTTDGVVMLGAYTWAFVKPVRKLYYNMTVTLVSVVIALFIGGIETLGLLSEKLDLEGSFWHGINALDAHFNSLGFAIVGVFIAAWLISYVIYHLKGIDRLDMQLPGASSRGSRR
jgi:high-affinity nickel-transport protein